MLERYSFVACVALAALALLPSGCKGKSGGAATDDGKGPIKIGAIFDLSGATSDVGGAYADGIKGYVEWRNSKGGIADRPIELLSADYAYKVDRAERLYSQYVSEGVVAFQGWGTGDTEALRGKIARDKIPFMSASYSAGLLDLDKAPYNFLVGTSYSDQAIIALRFAKGEWAKSGQTGTMKAVILHHDSPFGQSPVADAEAFAKKNDIELEALAMPRGATDYTGELAQVKQMGANYAILHTVSGPAAVLIKDARNQGLTNTVKFINLNWCADEIFIKLAKEAAEGVVGALPFAPPDAALAGAKEPEAFLQSKGSSLAETGLHYSQGWWTMAIMAEGVERAIASGKPLSGEAIRAALESLKDFDTGGITAPISFSPESHKGNQSLRLYRVVNGKWSPIDGELVSAGDAG